MRASRPALGHCSAWAGGGTAVTLDWARNFGRSHLVCHQRGMTRRAALLHGQELDDGFTGLADGQGMMTIAGFGSLLSERSARFTFPDLANFRAAKVHGFRRVFAHTAGIFHKRGIADVITKEVSSLSCEPWEGGELVVSLFEVPANTASIAAFIEREHEFRFLAVHPTTLQGQSTGRVAVLCGRNGDEEYRARRCPPEEWQQRYGVHGISRVWYDDLLPCRVYLRHCVLAAQGFCPEAHGSFLDATFLSDRRTTIREYLATRPGIMQEQPPPELAERYNG